MLTKSLAAVVGAAALCLPFLCAPAGASGPLPSQATARAASAVRHVVAGNGRADLVADPVRHVPGTTGLDRRKQQNRSLALAVDRSGVVTAVWRQTFRTADGTRERAILAARRKPAGRWSAPHTIGCGGTSTCAGAYPQVGVGGAGAVTVAWIDGTRLMAVRRPAGGRWKAPHVIGSRPSPTDLDLAVAGNGDVIIAWTSKARGTPSKVHAVVHPSGGSWGRSVTIGPGSYPHVAADAVGSALVVWGTDALASKIWASRHPAGHGWTAARAISPGMAEAWDVAMGPRGTALVTMDETESGVRSRVVTPKGPRGRWHELDRFDDACFATPVVDAAGAQTVAFNSPCGYGDAKVASRKPGQRWRSTTLARYRGFRYPRPQLVVNPRNDLAYAVGRSTLLRPHGSTWSAPLRTHTGALAVLAHGSALRMWWTDHGLMAQRIHKH